VARRAEAVAQRREPLSKERVLSAAMEIADREGIDALSMRRLASELGVEAMSLYYHVANKDDLLAGIHELVLNEVAPPRAAGDPMAAIRAGAISYHDTLRRHPWVHSLKLSPGRVPPTQMRYMEALLRSLRRAGFSARMTHHAYHILDSHIIGSTLWEAGIAAAIPKGTLPDLAKTIVQRLPPDQFPYTLEHIEQHMGKLPKGEKHPFEFGLDLILDGLEKLREAPPARPASIRRTDGRIRRSHPPSRRGVIPKRRRMRRRGTA